MSDNMTSSSKTGPEGATGQQPGLIAGFLPVIARLLMGVAFCVFGLNGFLHFIPEPKTPMPEGAAGFAGALMKTGYMFPMVMGTQLLVGVMLLVNRFVPLALVLIVPILVNIVAFHVFLQPAGIVPGAFLMALDLYLAWCYRSSYLPMLAARAKPGGCPP